MKKNFFLFFTKISSVLQRINAMTIKVRRARTTFNNEQLEVICSLPSIERLCSPKSWNDKYSKVLEQYFQKTQYPDVYTREELAQKSVVTLCHWTPIMYECNIFSFNIDVIILLHECLNSQFQEKCHSCHGKVFFSITITYLKHPERINKTNYEQTTHFKT